jgi:cytochrome c oxidase subunit 2
MLAPAGDDADVIHGVWTLLLWVCGLIYVAVLVALAVSLWQHVRREHTNERPLLRGLLAWVCAMAGILTALVAVSFLADRRLHADRQPPLQVRITAKQWWWEIEYLDADPTQTFTTANELHLPRDQPTRIELRSGDVIHSLWIPALHGKEDLIPGRHNELVLTPRRAGYYRGQCAEFCGLQHAHMALDVLVEEPNRFAAWRAHQLSSATSPVNASAQVGSAVFVETACAMCHKVRGTGAGGHSGPDLTHVASRRTLAAGTVPMDRAHLAA